MDVIALVRGGFAHAVAPLGTALTEDQLQLLWRTAPEPILAFDGDDAGAEGRASRRPSGAAASQGGLFACASPFCPRARIPILSSAKAVRAPWRALLDAAQCHCRTVLWRIETEGQGFLHPRTPRRAGAGARGPRSAKSPTARWRTITGGTSSSVFSRNSSAGPNRRAVPTRTARSATAGFQGSFRQTPPRPQPGTPEAVSPAVKASLLARAGQAGKARDAALTRKEAELALLLLEQPALALRHGELLAELTFQDRSLDRLRHELLNLAASGSSLEKAPVLTHLDASGNGRFAGAAGCQRPIPDRRNPCRRMKLKPVSCAPARISAPWRSGSLNGSAPFERFASEGSEESWREASRFLRSSHE